MMYETEEQQVEAIKEWWKENGLSVFLGILIGLAGVFGWRAWINHKDTVAAEASSLFEQLVTSIDDNKKDSVSQQVLTLHNEYSSTPYAAFADLMEARWHYEQGDGKAAQNALKRIIEKAPDPAVASIAVLRLARIQISSGEFSAAKSLLEQHPASAAFTAEYAALRGDIANAKGDIAGARRAYQEAIDGKAAQADLLKLKLDNLPSTS